MMMKRSAMTMMALAAVLAVPPMFGQDAPVAPQAPTSAPGNPPVPPLPPAGHDRRGRMESRTVVMHREDGPGGGPTMGIVPPGTWWRDPQTVKDLGLSADQTKKMDDIFLQERIQLIHMKASLEEEQLKLDPILNANPPNTGQALGEISKIADLRADLEKANAKMLLGLRATLTADQWTKLQSRRGPIGMMHGPGGPGAGGPRPGGQSRTTTCTSVNGKTNCTTNGRPDAGAALNMPAPPTPPGDGPVQER